MLIQRLITFFTSISNCKGSFSRSLQLRIVCKQSAFRMRSAPDQPRGDCRGAREPCARRLLGRAGVAPGRPARGRRRAGPGVTRAGPRVPRGLREPGPHGRSSVQHELMGFRDWSFCMQNLFSFSGERCLGKTFHVPWPPLYFEIRRMFSGTVRKQEKGKEKHFSPH